MTRSSVDNALVLSTARGEVKIATDLVNDPEFGPVHLLRVVGGGGGSSGGLTDLELRATPLEIDQIDRIDRLVGHVIVDNAADFPGGGGSSGGLTDTELRAAPVVVDVSDWPLAFGAIQSG